MARSWRGLCLCALASGVDSSGITVSFTANTQDLRRRLSEHAVDVKYYITSDAAEADGVYATMDALTASEFSADLASASAQADDDMAAAAFQDVVATHLHAFEPEAVPDDGGSGGGGSSGDDEGLDGATVAVISVAAVAFVAGVAVVLYFARLRVVADKDAKDVEMSDIFRPFHDAVHGKNRHSKAAAAEARAEGLGEAQAGQAPAGLA